ncbi:MAG: Flp pilus assembly protein CpaB [Actinomycetia bacterium]|jgi:pilus assembly protein CpaB|nr:Flp pilus assembly protein CpaB [Actinomycetes bacterium]
MTRRIAPILLAILLAGLGTVAVLAYVKGADARALAGKKAVTVVVAAKLIPAGTPAGQVRDGGFTARVQMPAGTIPAGTLGEIPASLDSLVTTADIQAQQLLVKGMFGVEKQAVAGLPVPEGKIAVSVQLQTSATVAGYVVPGSQIAVFDTFNRMEGKTAKVPAGDGITQRHEYVQATRVLLAKALVVAIGSNGTDGTTQAPAPDPAPSPSAAAGGAAGSSGAAPTQSTGMLMVTLAVSQSEAERLIQGAQTGTLYLGLLNDTSVVKPGPGVDNDSMFP